MAKSHVRPFVFVTGATGGVGQPLVQRLLDSGFDVLAAARNPVVAPASRGIGRVIPVRLDISDAASIEAAASAAAQFTGAVGLAGLVNGAGMIVEGPLEVVDPADFRRQFDVNVYGPFALTQALLPLLRTARGRVVNIGAATARTTVPFFGPISASKAALASITDAMRMEFAPFGIQVALIEPGALETGIFDRSAVLMEVSLSRQPAKAHFYRPAIAAMQDANRKAGADTPEVVVAAVMAALESRKAKPRALVGKGSAILGLLSSLPTSTRDGMLMNSLGLANALRASLKKYPGGPGPSSVRSA